jgi:hypothetical protein
MNKDENKGDCIMVKPQRPQCSTLMRVIYLDLFHILYGTPGPIADMLAYPLLVFDRIIAFLQTPLVRFFLLSVCIVDPAS